MVRKVVLLTAVFIGISSLAVGQGGWVYVVPPVDQAQIETVVGSSGPVAEKGLAVQGFVKAQAPLKEWVQEAAFDSVRACEDFRLEYASATMAGYTRLEQHVTMREWARERVKRLDRKALEGELEPKLRKLVEEEIEKRERDRKLEELLLKLPEDVRQTTREHLERTQRLGDQPFVDSAVRAKQVSAGRCVPASAMYPAR